MTLNNLVGNECPTEIAKLINAIIAQKATNSLDNLDAAGQKKFTDLANSISNVNDLVTALSALVDTKLSAEALLEHNGYIKFSNGWLLQWGKGTLQGTSSGTFSESNITLPLTYTSFYTGYCSINNGGNAWASTGYQCYCESLKTIKLRAFNHFANWANITVSWFTIGA